MTFISALDDDEFARLDSSQAFGPFIISEDGRDYFDIKISGQVITLWTKYLDMEFVLIPDGSPATSLFVVVARLRDDDDQRIPDFVYELTIPKVVFANTAIYDAGASFRPSGPGTGPKPLKFVKI